MAFEDKGQPLVEQFDNYLDDHLDNIEESEVVLSKAVIEHDHE